MVSSVKLTFKTLLSGQTASQLTFTHHKFRRDVSFQENYLVFVSTVFIREMNKTDENNCGSSKQFSLNFTENTKVYCEMIPDGRP